jgi:hypothetical protein
MDSREARELRSHLDGGAIDSRGSPVHGGTKRCTVIKAGEGRHTTLSSAVKNLQRLYRTFSRRSVPIVTAMRAHGETAIDTPMFSKVKGMLGGNS